jgi:hypothetical protein
LAARRLAGRSRPARSGEPGKQRILSAVTGISDETAMRAWYTLLARADEVIE